MHIRNPNCIMNDSLELSLKKSPLQCFGHLSKFFILGKFPCLSVKKIVGLVHFQFREGFTKKSSCSFGFCPNEGGRALPKFCVHFSQTVYIGSICGVECSEKTKSFNLKIPQPDSERRHSPDSKTVFEIMIGPFSFCEIGKT